MSQSQTIEVRFIRPWRQYRKGQVINPPAGQAREMMKRGIVVAVHAAAAPAGAVTMTPPFAVEFAGAPDGPKSGKRRK